MNVPGPGAYPSRTIVGSESVGKTMGMKILQELLNQVGKLEQELDTIEITL
jgi:hypothetical protein